MVSGLDLHVFVESESSQKISIWGLRVTSGSSQTHLCGTLEITKMLIYRRFKITDISYSAEETRLSKSSFADPVVICEPHFFEPFNGKGLIFGHLGQNLPITIQGHCYQDNFFSIFMIYIVLFVTLFKWRIWIGLGLNWFLYISHWYISNIFRIFKVGSSNWKLL